MLGLKHWGLRSRSIAFCVALLLGTVLSVCAAMLWHLYQDKVQEMTRHAVMNARSVGLSAEPYVLLNDTKAMEHVVAAVAATNDAVHQCRIVDLQGKVLARFQRHADFVPEIPLDLAELIDGEIARDSRRVERTANQLLVVVPIWPDTSNIDLGLAEEEDFEASDNSEAIGSVCLIYGLGHLHQEVTQSALTGVMISLAVLVIGVTVTIIIIRQLLTPVQNLVETATAISEGDLAKRARENAPGEIGVMARAFNHMAETLAAYTRNLEAQVTERTADLVASEAQTRAILDTAADGIITIDDTGLIESFNAAAERIFGYSASEVIGLDVSTLMPAPYAEQHGSFIARYLRTREAKIIGTGAEVEGKRKDGGTFRMDLAVSEVDLGGRRMFTGIVRDITGRKQAEAQLKKNMAELEQFNRLAVGRELRMIELKREVNELARQAGMEPAYDLSFAEQGKEHTVEVDQD